MTAQQVVSRLNAIAESKLNARELEAALEAVPLRNLWDWPLSETMAVETALEAVRRRLAIARSAESRRGKVRAP